MSRPTITLDELKRLQNISEISYSDILEYTIALDEYHEAKNSHIIFNLMNDGDLGEVYGELGQKIRSRLCNAEKRLHTNSFYKTIPIKK